MTDDAIGYTVIAIFIAALAASWVVRWDDAP